MHCNKAPIQRQLPRQLPPEGSSPIKGLPRLYLVQCETMPDARLSRNCDTSFDQSELIRWS